jgi:hypothetical protein
MSDTGHPGPQPAAPATAADAHALAHIEKWMAVIREVSAKPRGYRAEANSAPTARDD